MSKIQKHIRRADSLEDHMHSIPDGDMTGGMLMKPSKDQFGMHTHLYECEEDTAETGPAHDLPGHIHSLKEGQETSASVKMTKKPGDPWQKMDSLRREGTKYVLRSMTGAAIARTDSLFDAMKDYEEGHHGDAYDQSAMDAGVDEAKWKDAKKASIKSIGKIKWPLVQHLYQHM